MSPGNLARFDPLTMVVPEVAAIQRIRIWLLAYTTIVSQNRVDF